MCVLCIGRRHVAAGLAALLAAPLASSLAGCQVAPATGETAFNVLSPEEERRMGEKSHPQILAEFGGAYGDAKVAAYVAGIGQRLALRTETPSADFRFTVLDSDIVNAMALPGGFIYITRGLMALAGDEAELAGVLGHEIGHVTARHAARRYSRAVAANIGLAVLGTVAGMYGAGGLDNIVQAGAEYWLQAYSRENELEADTLGVRYMSRAGYNAKAMATMLERLRDQARLEAMKAGRPPDSVDTLDMMATHPRTLDRVELAIHNALGVPPAGTFGAKAYLDTIDGLIYGDDPAQGLVRGAAFIDPTEGFRFDVPAGFRLINAPARVAAIESPSGAVILFDRAPGPTGDDMGDYITRVWQPNATWRGLERITINTMPAATASARGRTAKGPADIRVVAIRFSADAVYRFTFATPTGETARLGEPLRRTTYSFRRLSPSERDAAKPWRIDVVTVGTDDTVASLTARMAMGQWKAETFRVLNRLDPGEAPPNGRRVKLVT